MEKNKLYIEIDTDGHIKIGKSESYLPKTKEEAGTVVIEDIKLITLALVKLIDSAHLSGYGTKEEYVTEAIKQLSEI